MCVCQEVNKSKVKSDQSYLSFANRWCVYDEMKVDLASNTIWAPWRHEIRRFTKAILLSSILIFYFNFGYLFQAQRRWYNEWLLKWNTILFYWLDCKTLVEHIKTFLVRIWELCLNITFPLLFINLKDRCPTEHLSGISPFKFKKVLMMLSTLTFFLKTTTQKMRSLGGFHFI